MFFRSERASKHYLRPYKFEPAICGHFPGWDDISIEVALQGFKEIPCKEFIADMP